MILYWTIFIAILGHMWPMGCRLDLPAVGKAVSHGSEALELNKYTQIGPVLSLLDKEFTEK